MTGRPETYKGLKDVGYDDFEKSMGDARYRRGVYNQLYINGGINSKYDVFEGSWQKTYGEPAAGTGETGVVNGDVEPVLDINSTRILGAEDFERYEAEQKPSSTMDTYDYEKMRVDPEKERQRLDAFRGELEEEGVNSESVYAAIDAGEKEIEKGWQEAQKRRDEERREDSRVPVGPNFARVEGMYEDTPAARDLSNFSLAKDLYDDARNLLDASFKGSGFGRGVWDAVYDVDAWTAGLTELGKNVQLNRVYEKAKKGEELTASEARLLDAANYYTLAGALQQAYLPSTWYSVGQGFGASVPFMLQFALTYGPASSVTKGLARAVFKKLGGGTVGRVAGESAEALATAAVQTPLNATSIASDTYDRMMGEAEVAVDENGVPVFMGMTDQKSLGQALGEATGAQYITNLAEVSGRMLSGAGHLIKRSAPRYVQEGLKKIADNRYVRAMTDNALTRGVRKVGKPFQLGNAPEEIYEEYVEGTLNSLLIGDTDLESLFSMQSFLEITGTVAVTQVFMGGLGAGMNHRSKRSLVKQYEKAEREYDALFSSPEERDMYVSYVNLNLNGVQGKGGKPMLTVLREAVEKMVNSHGDNFVRADGTFDTEAAKAYREEVSRVFGNYFVSKQLYDSYMAGIRTRKEADRERIATEMQEKAVNGQIMTVTLADGRRARVVSGDIVVDGDGRIDVGRSGDHFTAVYEDDGSTVQLPVEDSYTVEVVSVEDAVEAASRANDELINREEEEAVYGPRPKLGEPVTMLDSEGNRVQLVVSGEVDESGNFMAVPMEDFDNNVKGMAVAVNMSQIVRDDAASEGVDGANEYQSFVNEGTVSDATVERIAGKIANGESLTAEEEAMRQGANERVEGALAKLRDMEGEKQGESALSRIEKDAKGQPLYEKADVETAWDALVEQSEGDESIARDVAASMVKDKEAALKKMEKAPAKGATPAEKIADAKVRKENIDKARAELEHWQAIAGVSQTHGGINGETGELASEGDAMAEAIGRNRFGTIYQWTRGKFKEAAAFLRKKQGGYIKGVFHRDDIGDIDMIWGNDKAGLKHIIQKHIVEHDDFDSVAEAMETINRVIENGTESKQGTNISFDHEGYRVSIAQSGEGNWVLTAFDMTRGLGEKKRFKGDATIGDQNTSYMENGTLVSPQLESSESESIERIGEKQGKSEENAVISSEEDIDVTVGRVMEIPDAGDRSALVSGLLASAKAEEKSVSRVKNKVDPRNTQAFLAEQQRIRGEQDKARAEVAYWEEVKRIVEESNATESAPAEPSKVKAARPKSIRERISALGEVLNLRDYILRALATGEYKFIWGDNRNGTKGLGSHLGFGNNRRGIEERQRRIWLLNNEEGLYPEQVAERLYANIQAEYPYLAQDDVEVFNEMLDVLRYDSAKDMVSEAEDMRRRREEMYEEYDSDQAMYDATMQERDERVDAENEAYRRELESQESGTPAEGRAAEPLGDTVAAAEAEVNTNPTEKQKEAGNYRKGHVRIDGFNVTIENPKGSIRSGVDATGKEWSITMNNTYGYMRGTQGVDGDHIDVFLSDNPDNGNVYIVDQINQETGEFDEHKVMYGFNSMEEAKEAYLSNYSEGWKIGNVTEVSKEEFKKWVNSSHRKTKPFAEYSSINTISGESGDAVTDNLTPNTETTAIQGFDGYSQSEIKSIVQEYIQQKLDENDISANVVGIAVHGSRVRGNAKENSDLDVVVEYEGDIREDGMFNLLNDDDNGEALYIEGIRVDINPIRAQETGTLDKYMERSRKYDEEVLSNDSVEDSHGEGDVRYRKDEEKSGVGTDIQGTPVDENGTLFRYFTGSLSELISQARKSATNLIKKVIAPVSSRLRKDLNNQGLQIDDDYNHVIDNNAIRHTLKKHSGKNEEKRGQIPITETDFEYIADVVENYDAVEVVPSKTSAQRIIYRKAYSDGSVVYVEEQRVGRKELAAVTMWKKKSPNLTDANRFETTQISDLTEALVDKDSETSVTGQETAEKVDGEDTRYRRGEDGVQGVRRTQESEMEREVRGFGERMADRLGGGGRLVYSDEIADSEAHAEEKRRSKGYYDTATGEVVVVLDNNTVKGVPSVIEVAMTMMHEVVGHKGVRGLFGTKEDAFLDDVYRGMKARTKAEMESLYGGQLRRREGESEEAFEARRRRLLADEYIARVAEEGNNPGLLRRVGAKVRGLLRGLGVELAITDNEIRDILRRSARELTRRKDVAMNVREDGGVRYRRSGEEARELIGVHNLSEESLRKAFELGGFPMPSIAVTKADVGHTSFGDISLVFGKESIDPTDRQNKVYGEDAWTPTFPQVGYKLKEDKTSDIYRRANKVEGGIPFFNPVDFHHVNYERFIEGLGSESLVKHFKEDYGAKQFYLAETGNAVKEYERHEVEKYPEKSVLLYEKILGEIGLSRLKGERGETIENEVKRLIGDHYGVDFSEVKPFRAKMRIANTISHTIDYAEHGNRRMESDIEASKRKIDERIDAEAFEQWLEELFAGVVEKEGIRNDRDPFTPSGNRRKWEQLYDELTLDNVVEAMLRQEEKGGGGLFGGNIFGASQREYKTIEEIRKEARERIRLLDYTEAELARDAITDRLSAIDIPTSNNKTFGDKMDMVENITDAVSKSHTPRGIYNHLRGIYPKMTMDIAEEIAGIVKDIQQMSARYFEAKPRRAVGFEEVRLAVVPEDTDTNLVSQLESKGIPVRYYEKGNDVQRRSIVEEATEYLDIRFRLTEEEQGIVEEAKRDGSYMKAPNGAPTRLTEKQWAGVRTKAFKAWFGDWEKAARIEKLRKSEPVEISGEEYKGKYELNRDSAKQWLKENVRGEYVIADTGERIEVSGKGIEKVTSHSIGNKAHMQSLVAIPQLIENATFIEERPNEKANGKYDSYRYYVCGLKIGGVDYTVKVTIGVKQGKKYYDHALTEIEKGNLIEEIANGFTTTVDAPVPSSAVSKDTKLLSILQVNSLKDVDENGEPTIFGPTGEVDKSNGDEESGVLYRKVTDMDTLKRLEEEPTIKVYRAMANIDGKLYPPMSTKIDGKLRAPIELGVWEEAEERPDLVDEKGNFKLKKDNGTTVPARYNPYIHTSRTPLNDQFSSAYKRPNLVTVEVEVPVSELTSGYHAEKAKDSVGEKSWHAGPVSGKLPTGKKRKVILSRWDKPIRIVPDEEVAKKISEILDGENIPIPYNVITPSLRKELEKLGVLIKDVGRDDTRYRIAEEDYASVQEDAAMEYESALDTPMDISVADMMPIEAAENAQAAGLLRDVVNRFPDTKIAITDLSRVYAAAEVAEEEATEVRYRREVNERFNEELERQIAGELPKGHVYSLGRPSEVLLAAGIPDLPIELAASQLVFKSSSGKHDFDLNEVINLPNAIANPIAVFEYGNREKSQNILTILKHNGEHFLVGMFIRPTVKGRVLEINSVRNVFPKNGLSIARWIENGKLTYSNKKELLNFLDQQRTNYADVAFVLPDEQVKQENTEALNIEVDRFSKQRYNSADVRKLFNHAANIVKEFENPAVDGENVRYRRGISFDTRGASHRDTDITGRRERSFGEKASRLKEKAGISLYDEQLKLKQLQGKVAEWLTGSRKGALDDRLLFYEAENQAGSIAMDRKVRFDNEYRVRLFALRAEVFKALGNKVDDKYYFYAKTLNERTGVIGEEAMAANKATMFSHLLSEQHPGHDFPEGFFDPKEYGYEALQEYARKEGWIDSIEGYIADCESRMGEKLVKDIWGVIGEIAEYQLTTSMKKGLITRDHFDRLMYGRPLAELVRENLEKGLITEGQYRAFLATDFTADELVKAGFITREQREGLKRRYEYYLPLKGDSEPTTEEVADYERSRSRVSWQIKSVKGGNTRLVNDPVSRLLADVYASISYQEKMAWIQSMYHALRLAEWQGKGAGDFAILDNWVVKDETGDYVPYVRYVEGEPVFTPTEQEIAKGEVERARNLPIETAIRVPEAVQGEHIVKLKHRGRTIHIYFRDPAVANAVNYHFVPRVSPGWLKWAHAINRFRASVYTSYNPEFVFSNLFKDFGEAAVNNYVQYGATYLKEFTKNYGRVMRHAGTTLRGAKRKLVPTNDYERRVEEFFKYGGEVSYTQIESYEKAIRDFEKELKRSADKRGVVSVTKAGFVKIGKAVSAANKLAELNARLATFITSRERGYGLRQSIRDAKEVTVNFDRRGRDSRYFGAWFLFWNAGRQSNRRKLELFLEHPGRFIKSRAVIWTVAIAKPFLLGTIMSSLFGIDWEDYMTRYFDLPDFIRYNNIVFLTADGKVYRMPLSPSFRPDMTLVENFAELIYRKVFNDKDGKYDVVKGSADILKSLSADLGDPTRWDADGKGKLVGWAPAPIMASAELLGNTDFTGRPIYKKGNTASPGYKNVYSGTNSFYVGTGKWLNRVSGGEEAYGSWLGRNVNPAVVEHYVDSWLGGLGNFAVKIYGMVMSGIDVLGGTSDTFMDGRYEQIPFVGKLYAGDAEMLGEREVRDDIYDARRLVESYNDVRSNFRKTDEDYENNPKTSQYLENNEYRIDELKDLLKKYDEVTEELKSEDSEAYRRELRLLRRSIVELTNEMEEY